MFHFPIRHWNLEENGSVHFFGHLHSDIPRQWGRSYEVCVGGNELYPYHLPTLVDKLKNSDIIGRENRTEQTNLSPQELLLLNGFDSNNTEIVTQ